MALLLGTTEARAVEDDLPTGSETPRVEPIALADVYWAYHDVPPPFRQATLLTTAARHNEIAVNLVAIGARLQHAKLTGTVVLHAGTSVDALYGNTSGREVWKHIQLANVGWKTGDLHLEAGVLPSLFERESFVSTDNWNYTRAYIADSTPYYVSGLRASYRLTPTVTLNGTVVNGFNTFRNDDGHPSGHLRIAWAPSDTFNVANSVWVGPEQSDPKIVRAMNMLAAYFRPHARVELAGEGYYGRENGAVVPDPLKDTGNSGTMVQVRNPTFFGGVLWARWKFGETTWIAGRVEAVFDRAGILTGRGDRGVADREGRPTAIGQRLLGGTITLGWQPHPSFLARVEALHRTSNEPYFLGGNPSNPEPRTRNTTFVVSAAFAL